MSTEIDWSKAPEGAEFARVTIGHVDFYKTIEGVFSYLSDDGQWYPAITRRGDRDLIARPAAPAWSGEGLPPVGTVCECQVRGYGEWHRATILAHHNGHVWATGDDGKHCFTVPPHGNFRPLRTPEQIAADKRKKAIDEMVYGACGAEPDGANTTAFILCGLLYDAGYRKAEGGEK